MIHFFSNHADTAALQEITGEEVSIIKHPYLEPEWSIEEIRERCADVIKQAVDAEKLIINGDYSLVAIIVIARHDQGKETGFIAMKKFNEPSNEKDEQGRIVHKNILKPTTVRWV